MLRQPKSIEGLRDLAKYQIFVIVRLLCLYLSSYLAILFASNVQIISFMVSSVCIEDYLIMYIYVKEVEHYLPTSSRSKQNLDLYQYVYSAICWPKSVDHLPVWEAEGKVVLVEGCCSSTPEPLMNQ